MARDQWFSVVMWPSASPFGESVGEVDTPVAHGTTLDFSPPLREIGVEAGTSVVFCDGLLACFPLSSESDGAGEFARTLGNASFLELSPALPPSFSTLSETGWFSAVCWITPALPRLL